MLIMLINYLAILKCWWCSCFFLAINLQKQLAVLGTRFLRCLELRSLHGWCNRLKIINIMEINAPIGNCNVGFLSEFSGVYPVVSPDASDAIIHDIATTHDARPRANWFGVNVYQRATPKRKCGIHWYTLVYGIREHFLKWPKQLVLLWALGLSKNEIFLK